ncbi:hypothetical protein EVAR_89713_1 [Eumeta japonica]|uniref:PDZ domain-containing protein n=1 Tax=Eumeta variegata TaxID=151549 RepID=A0A4C1SN28_EUMVA|nr:hypothetical protein EVAR_89713_1 [Eumeta japonica]
MVGLDEHYSDELLQSGKTTNLDIYCQKLMRLKQEVKKKRLELINNKAPFRSTGGLTERKRALLDLSLRAATSAQRERFAEYPMRVVTAAADAMANVADYIVQEVSDPVILQPAALSTVLIHQGDRPLDFSLAPGCGGRHYLADIRFGSPAHASGLIEHGDEIVAVTVMHI